MVVSEMSYVKELICLNTVGLLHETLLIHEFKNFAKLCYNCQLLFLKTFSRSSHKGCSVKKVFLEISQNSQENTCARASFCNQIKKRNTFFTKHLNTTASLFLTALFNSSLFFGCFLGVQKRNIDLVRIMLLTQRIMTYYVI